MLRGAYPSGPVCRRAMLGATGQPPLGKRAFGRAIRESPLRRGSGRSDQGIAPYAAAGSGCHPEEHPDAREARDVPSFALPTKDPDGAGRD